MLTYDFDTTKIKEHFPKEEFRDGQEDCIKFALDSFNAGKRVVILECPTGSGKSTIGMTVADYFDESYYLTVTKILQDQLVDDFGEMIVELKGRNAYKCTYWDRYGDKMVNRRLMTQDTLNKHAALHPDCSNGFCKTKFNRGNKFKCPNCFTKELYKNGELTRLSPGMSYSDCPYYEQVYKAINSRKVTMNFHSFLYQTQMTTRFNVPRHLMIIDECHNIEQQLLDFVSIRLTDFSLRNRGIILPKLDSPQDYAVWFHDKNIIDNLKSMLKEALDLENDKAVDELTHLINKLNTFMDQMQTDIEWVSEFETKHGSNPYNIVNLKPVFIKDFANDLLFSKGERILLMSATILDVNILANSLGIDRDDIAAYRMKNRFPVKNRPIFIRTVGKMTGGKNNMHNWAPKMVTEINKICDEHRDTKGIIHTHNFAIMDYILEKSSVNVKKRLLNQRDFKDKQEMIAFHALQDNTILIAPAMHEGIDLKDDLSRFQIICKVPYANCFDDKQLARRVEVDRRYYTWITALKLIQSYGRSIRSETDYADTYILDESIHRFMDDARSMLPGWFTEAVM